MKIFIRHNSILILSTAVFVVLPFLYYYHKGEAPNIYLQCITTGVILLFGYATYKFQKETNEFNRLSKIPALNVDKDKLEREKIIYIENKNDYPAKNVYVGSFLFTGDGKKNKILYHEIQSQIIKSYPVIQADILKQDFRSAFEKDDKEEHGSTLKQRIESFIVSNQNNSIIYLVIALRSYFMNDAETLLFFYECTSSTENDLLGTLSFTSKHFSTKEQLYEKTLKEINRTYNKYRKKYKTI